MSSIAPERISNPTLLMATLMRLSRLLARSGACSRRQADAAIFEGRVKIGGRVAALGEYVDAATRPSVLLDDKPLNTKEASNRPRVFLAYKKKNELVARPDTDDRPTIFARLGLGRHVASVGRLDYDSEGLLVLTTCGDLARSLEHPDIGNFVRIYEVSTRGVVTPSKLTAMRRGVRVDGVKYQPLEVRVLRSEASRVVFQFRCTQGKNRMIRNICDHLRLRVTKLVRTHFGPFKLDQVTKSKPIEITTMPESVQKLIDANASSASEKDAEMTRRAKPKKKKEAGSKKEVAVHHADERPTAVHEPRDAAKGRRMKREKSLDDMDDGSVPESRHRRAGRMREAMLRPKGRNKKKKKTAAPPTAATTSTGSSSAAHAIRRDTPSAATVAFGAYGDEDRIPPAVENLMLARRPAPRLSKRDKLNIKKPRDPNSARRLRRRHLQGKMY